ncbi:thioesterase II family protein [Caldimonas brevitalea]|uniref:Thioesterase n=1 Tax=Caldimonas brevitalea TaxID=413882 RepID=A0A0G3BSH2_9BURK|nr:alpha/beta fold hydrolase [Caldimonas brevitalea]AKJ30953.1 thioesterase [Caldimonas brevitalea]
MTRLAGGLGGSVVPGAHHLNWHRQGEQRVLGFGYAGGHGAVFGGLAAQLPPAFGLAEFVMPGRQRRAREAPATTLERACEEAMAELRGWSQPPLLLGYSMGALLAYETARRLQAEGRPPHALLVCALNAPHRLLPPEGVHRYPLPRLQQHLARLGGTPAEVLNDLDVLACFAPAVQSDYALVETYRFVPSPPLGCPIVVLAGRQDDRTTGPGVAAWQELTTAAFREQWVDAGHFFLHAQPQLLAQGLAEAARLAEGAAPTLDAKDLHA